MNPSTKNPFANYADVTHELFSRHLQDFRKVHLYLPPSYRNSTKAYHVLYINDGQDMKMLQLKENLTALYEKGEIEEVIVVTIPAHQRIQEYGTAGIPDYKRRGSKAGKYSKFVINELIPFINAQYRTSKFIPKTTIIGFSLGGLTAFDICWNFPFHFGMTGAFSASFWWRNKAYEEDKEHDLGRIMLNTIKQGTKKEGLKFWFQAGTKDENEDRNNNGVIDAIDDTLDMMRGLTEIGYEPKDMQYEQVEGGEHNYETWSKILPTFLKWAYGDQTDLMATATDDKI